MNTKFGALLKAWMKQNDISVREAAKAFDTIPSTITRITQGKEVSQELLIKIICKLFSSN